MPSYSSSGSVANGTTSVAPACPATVAAGDVLVLQVDTNGSAFGTPSGVTGWVALTATAANSRRQQTWWKVADGTEGGATVTVSGLTSGTQSAGVVSRFTPSTAGNKLTVARNVTTVGTDTSVTTTAYSATGASKQSDTGGLWVSPYLVTSTTAVLTGFTSSALTQTGATIGATTSQRFAAQSSGAYGVGLATAPITTGGSGAPKMAGNGTGSATVGGVAHFLEIFEYNGINTYSGDTESFESGLPGDITTSGSGSDPSDGTVVTDFATDGTHSLKGSGGGDRWFFNSTRFNPTGDFDIFVDLILNPATASSSRDIANFAFWCQGSGGSENGFMFRMDLGSPGGFFSITNGSHNDLGVPGFQDPSLFYPGAPPGLWYRLHVVAVGSTVSVTVADLSGTISPPGPYGPYTIDVAQYFGNDGSGHTLTNAGHFGQHADGAGTVDGHRWDRLILAGSGSTSVSGTDSGTLTESTGTGIAATESGALADSSSISATPGATDSATLSDSSQVTLPATDSGTLTEGASAIVAIGTATDSATLADTSLVRIPTTDSGTLTETSTVINALVGIDSAALTDSSSLAPAGAATDSGALTEASAVAASAATTDTGTLTEGTSQVAQSSSDTGTLSDSSTVAVLTLITGTDTGTLTEGTDQVGIPTSDSGALADASSIAATVASADTGALTEASVAQVTIVAVDSATLSEFSTVTVTIASTDSGALTESSSVNTGSNVSGTDAGTLGDSSTLSVTVAGGADGGTLSDSSSSLLTFAGSDGGSMAEASLIAAQITGSDTATMADSSMLIPTTAASDGGTLTDTVLLSPITLAGLDAAILAETRTLLATLVAFDTGTLLEAEQIIIPGNNREIEVAVTTGGPRWAVTSSPTPWAVTSGGPRLAVTQERR